MKTLRDAIGWATGAVSKKDVEAYMGHYRFVPGGVEAYDGRTLAYSPMDDSYSPPDVRLVPADTLDRFLSRVDPEKPVRVSWKDTTVVWTCGGVRTQMPTLDVEKWPFSGVGKMLPSRPETPWQEWTAAHESAVGQLSPFISDNATKMWSACLIHKPPFAYATNNVTLARIPFPNITGDTENGYLWPRWLLDFIMPRTAGLSEWCVDAGSFWFRWKDGATCRITGVNEDAPALQHVAAPLDTLDEDSMPLLTDEWKDAWRMAVSLATAGSTLAIRQTEIVALGTNSGATTQCETDPLDVPDDHDSKWDPAFVTDVVESAVRWDTTSWPKPSFWVGAGGLRGIAMGRVE